MATKSARKNQTLYAIVRNQHGDADIAMVRFENRLRERTREGHDCVIRRMSVPATAAMADLYADYADLPATREELEADLVRRGL